MNTKRKTSHLGCMLEVSCVRSSRQWEQSTRGCNFYLVLRFLLVSLELVDAFDNTLDDHRCLDGVDDERHHRKPNRTKPNKKKNNGVRQKKSTEKYSCRPSSANKRINSNGLLPKNILCEHGNKANQTHKFTRRQKKEREEYAIHTLGRIQRCKRIFIGFMHRFPSVQI